MNYRQHREVDTDKSRPTRFFSDKQEKTVAKEVGGKQTKNSGATPWQKSDVSTDLFTIECKTKTTNSKSISIQKAWLDKLKNESLFMNTPYETLIFNFGPDSENYAIINMQLFNILQKILREMDI